MCSNETNVHFKYVAHPESDCTGTKKNAPKEGTGESKWSVLRCSYRDDLGVGGHVSAVLL